MPDLIIIDGGKGQLSSAKKILDGLGITTPVISLAKQEEEIFFYDTSPASGSSPAAPRVAGRRGENGRLGGVAVQTQPPYSKTSNPLYPPYQGEEKGRSGGKFQSIRLPYNSPALYLIERMRDEAHRFTITYHRLLRSKAQKRSILDEVPGIGPKTKKKLLAQFGSLKTIRTASDEDLSKILGPQKMKILREYI